MKIRATELREKSVEELETLVSSLKEELLRLRQKKNTQSLKPHEIRVMRKNIARVLTVRTEKLYAEMYEKHKNDRRMPKDLRPRLTKAKRMALTPRQRRMSVHSVCKRRRAYPRMYFSYSEPVEPKS